MAESSLDRSLFNGSERHLEPRLRSARLAVHLVRPKALSRHFHPVHPDSQVHRALFGKVSASPSGHAIHRHHRIRRHTVQLHLLPLSGIAALSQDPRGIRWNPARGAPCAEKERRAEPHLASVTSRVFPVTPVTLIFFPLNVLPPKRSARSSVDPTKVMSNWAFPLPKFPGFTFRTPVIESESTRLN